MALTIQELLSSDTVSQVVDKINFNFDQLLLNGGGPVGPLGPAGLPGPIGGRGERGTEWYEGTDSPLVTPPTLTPLANDYYLQSNGNVWLYQLGGPWVQTGTNLTGPTGSTGSSVGLSQFGYAPNPGVGTYTASAKNVSYPSLIPQSDSTITPNNEGVPTFAVGIAGPNDPDYPTVPLTNAYQLSTTMAGQLSSENTSMLIHQKNSAAQAIRFMGGGGFENYVQDQLSLLSNISLLADDVLSINVPKEATSVSSIADTYGIINETVQRGQSFRAGTGFSFTSGTIGANPYTASGSSDFNIELNSFTPLDGAGEAKFDLKVLGASAQANLQVGGNINLSGTIPPLDGRILAEAGEIVIQSNEELKIRSNFKAGMTAGSNAFTVSTTDIVANASGSSTIDLQSNDGLITIENVGNGYINILSNQGISLFGKGGANPALPTIINVFPTTINLRARQDGANVNIKGEGVNSDINIQATGEIRLGKYSTPLGSNMPRINIKFPESGVSFAHTEFVGYQSWAKDDNAPQINDPNIYQRYYTDFGQSNRTIQQFGSYEYITPPSTQFQQFNDGENQVIIGIPSYDVPSAITEDTVGIYVNSLSEQIPPQFDTTGSNNRNPASEMFRVDKEVTKISNKLILGGENNIQEFTYDPFNDWQTMSPALVSINVTKPFIRIQIGSTDPIDEDTYNYWAGFNGGEHIFNPTFRLNFENSNMAFGQTVLVELYWAPSIFRGSDIPGSDPTKALQITQSGVMELETYDWKEGVGFSQQYYHSVAAQLEVDADNDIRKFGDNWLITHSQKTVTFIFSGQGDTPFYNSSQGGAVAKVIQKGWNTVAGSRYSGAGFITKSTTLQQHTFVY